MAIQKMICAHTPRISQLVVVIFLFATVCSSFGQAVGKKSIPQEEYSKWSNLYAPILSNDGKWAAWRLNYPGITDTLMILNTHNKKVMKYKEAVEYEFSPNSKWLYSYHSDRTLQLINLERNESKNFPDLELFYFSDAGDYAGVLDANNRFSLVDLETGKTTQLEHVSWFKFSPNGKWAAITFVTGEKNSIVLMDVQSLQKSVILKSDDSTFSRLAWNEKSSRLAFMETKVDTTGNPPRTLLHEFQNGSLPKLLTLHPPSQKGFPMNTYMEGGSKIFYAADGERLFFYVRPKSYLERNIDTLKNKVQVWKGDDPWIVPQQLRFNDPAMGPWLMQWKPEQKELLQIATEKLPNAYLLPNEHYALLFDKKQYEPQFKYEGDADFYVMDLNTKDKKRMVEKHTIDFKNKYPSPNGKYIAYYKNKKWWVYTIPMDSHTDVSVNLPFDLDTTDHSSSNAVWPYGFAGWSPDNKWVYIYDEFDIWKVSVDGREFHRITNGREDKTVFRFYRKQYEEYPFQRFERFTLDILDTEKDILLEANGPKHSGYYSWNSKKGITPLFTKDTKVDNLKQAKEAGSYIVQEESFDIPRRIYFLEDGKEALLYESNLQHKDFVSPRQELISYKSFDGRDLQGILMYPDGYVEGVQYPMIVHIYERLSDRFYNYITPTMNNGDGFNPKVYTGQGYFVLYPDIVYKLGDPGISALQCVKAAVESVLKTEMVDKDRMALQGHSFGGYEAAFIATQTNMFAAIVSGAGVTDFRSFYLTVGGYDGRPDSWWFEEHQWRMGTSYFDAPEAYKRNSPMDHVQQVNIPILLWSGADDVHIDVRQNIEFYLALRRLGKDVTFLNYPNETHAIQNSKNQKDLTNRISNWLAGYLKP
ncbi:prolyl oligopeptidase family serine peptidase [Aequorivita soesokkakensis]|nr:prolyl oligopeptidase family serine peptidase [Aequorivita soesokkakensis]